MIQVDFEAIVSLDGGAEDLEGCLDRLMERLMSVGAPDPSVSASLATGMIEIQLTFQSDDMREVVPASINYILQALQDEGFELPPNAFEAFRAQRELVPA